MIKGLQDKSGASQNKRNGKSQKDEDSAVFEPSGTRSKKNDKSGAEKKGRTAKIEEKKAPASKEEEKKSEDGVKKLERLIKKLDEN